MSRNEYFYDLITKDSYAFISITLYVGNLILMQREHLVLNMNC